MTRICSLLACLLVAPLSAQLPHVSPSHFARAEGNTQANLPGTYAPHAWHLQIHDNIPAGVVHGLRFRVDGPLYAGGLQAQATLNIVVRMGAAAAGITAATPTINRNLNFAGGTATQVLANTALVVGPATGIGCGNAFDLVIPFTTQYTHNGVGSLVWEIEMGGSHIGLAPVVDAATGSDQNPAPVVVSFADGCPVYGHGGTPAQIAGSASVHWNGASSVLLGMHVNGGYLPRAWPGLVLLGSSRTSFSGLPLPLPLPGPPGCFLHTSVFDAVPFATDNGGAFGVSLAANVPISPAVHAGHLYAQAVGQDPITSQLYSTNAVDFQFIAPWSAIPVGKVMGASTSLVGYGVWPHDGLIVEFY